MNDVAQTELVQGGSHVYLLLSSMTAQCPSSAQPGECDMTLSTHDSHLTGSHISTRCKASTGTFFGIIKLAAVKRHLYNTENLSTRT